MAFTVTRRRLVRHLAVLLAAAGLAAAPLAPARAEPQEVLVFAAASLKNALDDINAAWKSESGRSATISYAASSVLAKQIESGAPADLFFSADRDWMDYLAKKDLIRPDSRAELLGNSIVLVAPAGAAKPLDIAPGFPLATALGDGKLAMGSVDSVPAGKYGKAALEKLGVWQSVSAQVAQADNVRAALLLVSRGEAPLGIVYKTDAAADKGVAVVGTFPADTHPPIVYPVALTKTAKEGAADFLAFLKGAKAKSLFEAQGFTVLP
ncbi:molybdate ABC transporter substrate-binding protein [Aureimonas endophytica]|uniref:Molybdate ABC transporter substrate-binding protein n=1 Tax=Aureimonas endophytica TaxID=2027858 RepID=A0A917E758_9HYPH|nr:molybdate ABC transporter substrate-binding protein [Aureimonas endophytica]GGE10041.1 molybdate ABC transporter substrate-binding protein [Aureimonas endophytica]